MTWLPTETASLPERDAVLGLKPDVYQVLREMLTLAWQITDARLLDLCRVRLAQIVDARAELAGMDGHFLSELRNWHSSAALSERERAALSFAEQYHVDHRGITTEQQEALARHLSRREVVNFVWALHMNDAYARVLSLLDIEPDPPSSPARSERLPREETRTRETSPSPGRTRLRGAFADADPEFVEAYGRLGRVTVRQALVDEVTSEAIRLHNASHQGCLY